MTSWPGDDSDPTPAWAPGDAGAPRGFGNLGEYGAPTPGAGLSASGWGAPAGSGQSGPDVTAPFPLLGAAAILAVGGLAVSAWPPAPAAALLGAWAAGGVVALVLVVLFTHVDVKRQATGRYLGSGLVPPLRVVVCLAALACVVVCAVRFATIVSHQGWGLV